MKIWLILSFQKLPYPHKNLLIRHRIKLAQNLARQTNKVALMSSESANRMRENILVLWGNLNAKQ